MKKRRISAFILTLGMMNGIICSVPVSAERTHLVFEKDDIVINYYVNDTWSNYQNIEIVITNESDTPLKNWALKYDTKGEISNIWNGVIVSDSDNLTIIKNLGYNYVIRPEESISFGYTLYNEKNCFPDNIELCSNRFACNDDSYEIELNVENNWEDGFVGTIDIRNIGDHPFTAWELSFDTNFSIESMWNANILNNSNNRYTVENDITTLIDVGETKSFGFIASKGHNVEPIISNCEMALFDIEKDGIDEDSIINYNDLPNPQIVSYGYYDENTNSIVLIWDETSETSDENIYNVFIIKDNQKQLIASEKGYSFEYNIDDYESEYRFIIEI